MITPLSCLVQKANACDLWRIKHIMDKAFDPMFGEAWTEAQCSAMLIMPGSWFLIATVDGEAVGFALIRSAVSEAELMLIAVDPLFQNRKIGRLLLTHILSDCKNAAIDVIHLEVRANNPALIVYESIGFQRVGIRKNYYRGPLGRLSDAITLTCRPI